MTLTVTGSAFNPHVINISGIDFTFVVNAEGKPVAIKVLDASVDIWMTTGTSKSIPIANIQWTKGGYVHPEYFGMREYAHINWQRGASSRNINYNIPMPDSDAYSAFPEVIGGDAFIDLGDDYQEAGRAYASRDISNVITEQPDSSTKKAYVATREYYGSVGTVYLNGVSFSVAGDDTVSYTDLFNWTIGVVTCPNYIYKKDANTITMLTVGTTSHDYYSININTGSGTSSTPISTTLSIQNSCMIENMLYMVSASGDGAGNNSFIVSKINMNSGAITENTISVDTGTDLITTWSVKCVPKGDQSGILIYAFGKGVADNATSPNGGNGYPPIAPGTSGATKYMALVWGDDTSLTFGLDLHSDSSWAKYFLMYSSNECWVGGRHRLKGEAFGEPASNFQVYFTGNNQLTQVSYATIVLMYTLEYCGDHPVPPPTYDYYYSDAYVIYTFSSENPGTPLTSNSWMESNYVNFPDPKPTESGALTDAINSGAQLINYFDATLYTFGSSVFGLSSRYSASVGFLNYTRFESNKWEFRSPIDLSVIHSFNVPSSLVGHSYLDIVHVCPFVDDWDGTIYVTVVESLLGVMSWYLIGIDTSGNLIKETDVLVQKMTTVSARMVITVYQYGSPLKDGLAVMYINPLKAQT